jgi:hypothetical protein
MKTPTSKPKAEPEDMSPGLEPEHLPDPREVVLEPPAPPTAGENSAGASEPTPLDPVTQTFMRRMDAIHLAVKLRKTYEATDVLAAAKQFDVWLAMEPGPAWRRSDILAAVIEAHPNNTVPEVLGFANRYEDFLRAPEPEPDSADEV